MCEYCIQHGSGKRWYENARNFSKDLATSDLVREFCLSYFGRDIDPGSTEFRKVTDDDSGISDPLERKRVDRRYRLYVHHQVVTAKEAMAILDLASKQTDEDERAVVRFPCICRYQVDGEDPGSHCYGIAFTDEYTRRFPKYLGGNHDYVSAEIAIDTLEKMVLEEPIVHAVSALRVPYIGLLCNCDMRVCQPYIKRLRLGIDSPFHKGHYAATVDEDSCSVCGTCENVCPFGAAAIDEKDVCARINVEACFGCGICMGRCPEEAISLVEAPRETGF